MEMYVLGLTPNQLLELATNLLLLAQGELEESAIELETKGVRIVFCAEAEFAEVCKELEQTKGVKSTEDGKELAELTHEELIDRGFTHG